MNFILWHHLSNRRLHLTAGVDENEARYFYFRAITVPVIFVVTGFVYFLNPRIAMFVPPFIPIVVRLCKKFFVDKKITVKKPRINN